MYKISNFGVVKSFKYDKENGRILSSKNSKGGYPMVHLRKNNKEYAKRVHELVCQEFISPKIEGYQVHHKDGNKQNNNVNNLEYIPQKEHLEKTFSENPVLKRKLSRSAVLRFSVPVIQLSLKGEFVERFNSAKEAGRKTGIDPSTISKVIRRDEYRPGKTRQQAGGYIWILERDYKK